MTTEVPKQDDELNDARIEIYVRMNDDHEKDYCFSVGIDDDFHSLLKIFDTLTLSLRPSIFYKQKPIGFKISNDPGYLTENGGLLFTSKSSDNSKPVKLSDKISEHCWPGHLVLPVWKEDNFKFYNFSLILLLWLYTDLPDTWSPTPGICLTNQVSKILSIIIENVFNNSKLAADIYAETIPYSTGLTAQYVFFSVHILKIIFIFLFAWTGLYNPYSINPLVNAKVPKLDESKKNDLIAVGWTGSRKATIDEFREFYREYRIKEVGGIVKASRAGLFETLGNPGITLSENEGFQSDLKNETRLTDLKSSNLFTLNYEFFEEIGVEFEKLLSGSSTNPNQDIKNFRKYGPLKSSKIIKDIYSHRKQVQLESAKEK
ncbi:hypothetical protein WICMUC_003118 [Wickerhamomyces mucosus]|uniref:Glucose-signaling factor 2 n=1 Tax=Wickerhamomyces mucosus TaxID=1378264 RepID=A0A9P8PMC5_9ASCO|nr:hypothetical protein WICMUC_003118 [Wickerhamomyces mucosus]